MKKKNSLRSEARQVENGFKPNLENKRGEMPGSDFASTSSTKATATDLQRGCNERMLLKWIQLLHKTHLPCSSQVMDSFTIANTTTRKPRMKWFDDFQFENAERRNVKEDTASVIVEIGSPEEKLTTARAFSMWKLYKSSKSVCERTKMIL